MSSVPFRTIFIGTSTDYGWRLGMGRFHLPIHLILDDHVRPIDLRIPEVIGAIAVLVDDPFIRDLEHYTPPSPAKSHVRARRLKISLVIQTRLTGPWARA